jgi:hypothetical protein
MLDFYTHERGFPPKKVQHMRIAPNLTEKVQSTRILCRHYFSAKPVESLLIFTKHLSFQVLCAARDPLNRFFKNVADS